MSSLTMVVPHELEGSLVTLVASADDLGSGGAVLEELALAGALESLAVVATEYVEDVHSLPVDKDRPATGTLQRAVHGLSRQIVVL